MGREVAAVLGVLASVLRMIKDGATHVAVATDHVIESFRNDLWPGGPRKGLSRTLQAIRLDEMRLVVIQSVKRSDNSISRRIAIALISTIRVERAETSRPAQVVIVGYRANSRAKN